MTTFGLPAASESLDADFYAYLPPANTPQPVPNVMIHDSEPHFLSSDDHTGSPSRSRSNSPDIENPLMDAVGSESDYQLVATQPQTQPEEVTYRPEMEQNLVGCLVPATPTCPPLVLEKSKKSRQWTIGRDKANNLVISEPRLSNFHCTLTWNGLPDKFSEVKLTDHSSNGTWINNTYLRKGQKSLLRGGAAICMGGAPDNPESIRYIFRDVEGQSTRHANQIWAKYDLGHELGSGGFARVYKCIERATGIEYAVKIIDKGKLQRSHVNEQAVIREIAILQQLTDFRHKNIVALHEHFEEQDAIYLILELVRGGDLLTYISTHGPLAENQVRRMAAQICHAVAYVHSQGITHRDLKPENVMVTETSPPDCKVADFGLAKLVDNHTFLKTLCGTPAYLAPEVVLRQDPKQAYDSRVDSWSLGIIFYCMLTNSSPFKTPIDHNADHATQKNYFVTRKVDWELLYHIHLSEDGIDFLRNMLIEDPRNRKTVANMLDHHWISHLVPADSQFQYPPPRSLSPSESSATPPTTDGAIAFSQSMGKLNLNELSIPGLSMNKLNTTTQKVDAAQQSMYSFQTDSSVTAKIPGAFPKPKMDMAQQHLAAVEEAAEEGRAWDFAESHRRTPGPSRGTASPHGDTKRKSNLIAGNSPLSSLSSSENEQEDAIKAQKAPKKPIARRNVPRGKSVEASGNKRKGRPSSSTPRPRRVAPKDDEEYRGATGRRLSRPPAKAARYS